MNEYEVLIEKFDHEGRGIGYVNGKTTFVDSTIPGDLVKVTLIKDKKNYCIAKVIKFLKYSNDRINPKCPYFNNCGGCDLQHIGYENQLKFKEMKVREILIKFANIDECKIKPIIGSDNEYFYRNKLTFQVKEKIGLFSKNSYDLISVDKCYIASNKINQILVKIKDMINLQSIEQIIIRNSFYTNKVMVIFVLKKLDIDNIRKLEKFVDSLYIKINNQYKLISGNSCLEEKLGNYIFKISPDSFFQVNTKTCIKLYDKILEYGNFKKDENVLDLYCGTGTIGIYISKFVNSVIGYEINKYAIADAIENKNKNLVDNVQFICESSDLSFKNITINIDTIIVDPPRSGLNQKTIDGIRNVKPCKVIYVSCDPVTLARDIKILCDIYNLIEITPVDMFPNTKHVECVSLLKIKK